MKILKIVTVEESPAPDSELQGWINNKGDFYLEIRYSDDDNSEMRCITLDESDARSLSLELCKFITSKIKEASQIDNPF